MMRTLRGPATDPAIRMQRLCALSAELGEALCERLPGTWEDVHAGLYQAAIGTEDGRQLTLTATTGAKGEDRLVIGTRFSGDIRHFATGHWEVSVAVSRGADVIAREIQRRLLPDLDAAVARALPAMAAEEARKAALSAVMDHIDHAIPAAQLPSHSQANAREINGPGGLRGEILVSWDATSGELRLREVPVERFKTIATALGPVLGDAPQPE